MFLHKNIFCDPSLELSGLEGPNQGSQHRFFIRTNKNKSTACGCQHSAIAAFKKF